MPEPTQEHLLTRFKFTPEQLRDKRIKRLLFHKWALDTDLYHIHEALHTKALGTEELVDKTLARFGFTPADVQKSPSIKDGARALADSIAYLAHLQSVLKRKPVTAPATKPPLQPKYPEESK